MAYIDDAQEIIEVTPSDTKNLAPVPTTYVYVGTAGNLKVDMSDGKTVTYMALAAGTFHRLSVMRIYANGTTAQNIIALYKMGIPKMDDYNYVRITTTGATFSPKVELASGVKATVYWDVEGDDAGTYSAVGLNPTINFGSAAVRYVRMRVANNIDGSDALDKVATFNIGFASTEDSGRYNIGATYNHADQLVSALEHINRMTGLVRFLAATASLVSSLDFTGMSKLEFIECYNAQVTSVNLTGCSSLIRLCLEGDDMDGIDLNPVCDTLRDLRVSLNNEPFTFVPLKKGMPNLYHYCCRDQDVVNQPPMGRMPAVEEFYNWNTLQSGPFRLNTKGAADNIRIYDNLYTSVDMSGCMTEQGSARYLWAYNNKIAYAKLDKCAGLTGIDLHGNMLSTQAIDAILAEVESWGTSDGTLNLDCNSGATDNTKIAALQARGWTVTCGVRKWIDQFTRANAANLAGVANGWHRVLGTSMEAKIANGELTLVHSAAGYNVLVNPAGGDLPADYTVHMTIGKGPRGTFYGLVGRWASGNGVRVLITTNTTATVTLNIWDASPAFNSVNVLSTNIIGVLPVNWAREDVEHTLTVKFVGTTITVYADGKQVGQATCATNAAVLNTEVGFCGEAQNRIRKSFEVIV